MFRKFLVFILFSLTFPSFVHADWTQRTGSGLRSWGNYIASSYDGTKLATVEGVGYIYTSDDSGVTWTQRTTPAGSVEWNQIVSSSDGTKLVARTSSYLYTSNDSGATWIERDYPVGVALTPGPIAFSSDGTTLVVSSYDVGNIHTSTDFGATWTERVESLSNVTALASSSDGTKLVAAVTTNLYTSNDSGVTWTLQEFYPDGAIVRIVSSSDGVKLAAINNAGYVYTSDDSGVTWTQHFDYATWVSIASSSDGSKLAVVSSGSEQLYVSEDSGATWTQQTQETVSGLSWVAVALSGDGTKIVAAPSDSNYIYTYVSVSAPTLTTNTASSVTSSGATLNATVTDYGGADATQHGFAYGIVSDLSTVIATSTLGALVGNTTFNEAITGLSPNTTYYARAYSTNTAGTSYGSIVSLTTSVTVPTVTTNTASSIFPTFATLNGTVSSTGGATVTARGFVYGPTTAYGTTTIESGSFSAGGFSASITGFICATTYHYKAYATNTSGTTYGSDDTFTTSPCVVRSSFSGAFRTSSTPVILPVIPPPETPPEITPPSDTPPTEPSVNPDPKCTLTGLLKRGKTGDEVKCLQTLLKLDLIVDGVFGSKTRAAVITFQKNNNLVPDGIVGNKTRSLLLGN